MPENQAMELVVLGATGRTGRHVVDLARSRGHSVVALVRSRAAVPSEWTSVTLVEGDVLDPAAVTRLIRRAPVISTLGGAEALVSGMQVVVDAMKAQDARRILTVVGAGVMPADATRLVSELPGFPEPLRAIAAAHRRVYEILRTSGLDWTLVCTPNLPDGPPTGRFAVAQNVLPQGRGAIATGDLATFLLDELERGEHIGVRVGLNGL